MFDRKIGLNSINFWFALSQTFESNKEVVLADKALQKILKLKENQHTTDNSPKICSETESDITRVNFYISEFTQRLKNELSAPQNDFWKYGQLNAKNYIKVNDRVFEYINGLSIEAYIEKAVMRVMDPYNCIEPSRLSSGKKKRSNYDSENSGYEWTLEELVYQKAIGQTSHFVDSEFRNDNLESSTIFAKELQFWLIDQYCQQKNSENSKSQRQFQKVKGGIFVKEDFEGEYPFWIMQDNFEAKLRVIEQRHKVLIKNKSSCGKNLSIQKKTWGDNESCCTRFDKQSAGNKADIGAVVQFNFDSNHNVNKTPIKSFMYEKNCGIGFNSKSIKKSNRANNEFSENMLTPNLNANKIFYRSSSEGSKNLHRSSVKKSHYKYEYLQNQQNIGYNYLSKNLFGNDHNADEYNQQIHYFEANSENYSENYIEKVETDSTGLTEQSNNGNSNSFFSNMLDMKHMNGDINPESEQKLLINKKEFEQNITKGDFRAIEKVRQNPIKKSESFDEFFKGSAKYMCDDHGFDMKSHSQNSNQQPFESLINFKKPLTCHKTCFKRIKVNTQDKRTNTTSSKFTIKDSKILQETESRIIIKEEDLEDLEDQHDIDDNYNNI